MNNITNQLSILKFYPSREYDLSNTLDLSLYLFEVKLWLFNVYKIDIRVNRTLRSETLINIYKLDEYPNTALGGNTCAYDDLNEGMQDSIQKVLNKLNKS